MTNRKRLVFTALTAGTALMLFWMLPKLCSQSSHDRVETARIRCNDALRERFAAAGVKYPARSLYLRAFKHEDLLEVWARNSDSEPFVRIAEYSVLAASGTLGPKRKEGDRQVPEGFYLIDTFNPQSSYHLSMRVNYPNRSDKILSDKTAPGGDIYIHGRAASIGCLAMGDPAIEEIYLLTWDAYRNGEREIPVHLFPCKMTDENQDLVLKPFAAAKDAALEKFWEPLRSVYQYFESTKKLPPITTAPDGSYLVQASG